MASISFFCTGVDWWSSFLLIEVGRVLYTAISKGAPIFFVVVKIRNLQKKKSLVINTHKIVVAVDGSPCYQRWTGGAVCFSLTSTYPVVLLLGCDVPQGVRLFLSLRVQQNEAFPQWGPTC